MSHTGHERFVESGSTRRFQFGVKTLLSLPICVAAFCAIGAWLGWPLAVLFLSVPTVIFSRRLGNTGVETATLLVVVALIAGLLVPAVQSGPPTMADGFIILLPNKISRQSLQALLKAADGDTVGKNW